MPSTPTVDAISATLRFIEDEPKWKHEKPYVILSPELDIRCPPTNVKFVEHTRVIKDLRTTNPDKVLGPDLFHLVNHESRHLDSVQQEDNDNPYVHETVELLQRVYQTDCVIAYNVRVRIILKTLIQIDSLCAESGYSSEKAVKGWKSWKCTLRAHSENQTSLLIERMLVGYEACLSC